MGALLVVRACEIPRGSLVLRIEDADDLVLTDTLHPKTEKPGLLPNSLVDDVVELDEDMVRVIFRDGTDVVVHGQAHAEAC